MLCSICQKIDIRHVLLSSVECKTEDDFGIFHEELHETAKYHDDIFAVQAAAESGCQLCAVVWHQIQGQQRRCPLSSDELANRYSGQLFIGTGAWYDESPEEGFLPGINVESTYWVNQNGGRERKRKTICSLDVYAKRSLLLFLEEVSHIANSSLQMKCLQIGRTS